MKTPRWQQEKHIREHTAQAEQKPGYNRPLYEVAPNEVSPEWAAQQRALAAKQQPKTDEQVVKPKLRRGLGM